MRKKVLIEQNTVLFSKLNEAERKIDALSEELKEKNSAIKEMKLKIEKLESEKNTEVIEPIKEIVKTETAKTAEKSFLLAEDKKYASEIIGKIVVESANFSNTLTADGNTKYIELVNLILGKTEVAKADILAVVLEDISLDSKKIKMNEIFNSTIEYFNSVMAQR